MAMALRKCVCIVIISICMFAIIGCGTIINIMHLGAASSNGEWIPYGGIKHDIFCLSEGRFASDPLGFAIARTLCVIDMPLSIIGDTLTLPICLISEGNQGNRAGHNSPQTEER